MPKFNEFIKGFEEKETATKPQEPKVETAPKAEEPKGKEQVQPTPKKQYGGIAGDLQKAGFEPYEVNEKEDYLKVKNKDGKDFEIRNSGKGYNYNVFEDGKQTYQYVPNYKYFENIVGGKNLGEFEKYRFKEAPQVQTPKAPEVPKTPEAPKPTKQVKFNPKGQYGNVAYWLQKAGFEPSEVNEEGGFIKVKNKEGKDYEIRGSKKPYEYNVFENGKQIYKDVPDSAVFENILSGKDLESFERYRASETPEQSPAEIASAHFGKVMTPTKWSENTFETEDGEEWFIGTEEEAREEAKEQIKSLADDMGIESFTPDFQDWILGNALDENFISQLQDEEADYLEEDGEAESAEQIRSMSEDDFADYLRGNYGDKEFSDLIKRNNAIDWDKVAEEAIDWDGIAHFIASYDGEEEELPNGLFAYRIN